MQVATVVGVFADRERAERAVKGMRDRGFSENEISIVAKQEGGQVRKMDVEAASEEFGGPRAAGRGGRGRAGGPADAEAGEDLGVGMGMDVGEATGGTAWGGALGGVAGLLAGVGALAIPGIGPIVAAGPLAATLSGAVAGGISGGLLDLGIPDAEGRQYEEDVKQGKILSVIEASDAKIDDAATILRQHGAQDVKTFQKKGEPTGAY